jgi:hypothetical protein
VSRPHLTAVPEVSSCRGSSAAGVTPDGTTPLTLEDTFALEAWAVRVQAGEVPPREVGATVREFLGRVRATLAGPAAPAAPEVREEDLVTVKQAAELLQCAAWGVYDRIDRGVIPEHVVSRISPHRIRIRRQALLAWLREGGAAAEAR